MQGPQCRVNGCGQWPSFKVNLKLNQKSGRATSMPFGTNMSIFKWNIMKLPAMESVLSMWNKSRFNNKEHTIAYCHIVIYCYCATNWRWIATAISAVLCRFATKYIETTWPTIWGPSAASCCFFLSQFYFIISHENDVHHLVATTWEKQPQQLWEQTIGWSKTIEHWTFWQTFLMECMMDWYMVWCLRGLLELIILDGFWMHEPGWWMESMCCDWWMHEMDGYNGLVDGTNWWCDGGGA